MFLKNIKYCFTIILIIFFIFSCTPLSVLADDYGLDKTAEKGFGAGQIPFEKKDLPEIIGQIVGPVLAFIGILFFILIIYGGFLWMTARGNEEQVKKATSIIIQAVIGLIIVSAAYLITKFIGEILLNPVT